MKIISRSYAIGNLPCLFPTRSSGFHALLLSPLAFSHSISPGAYAPLLCNNIHTHTREAAIFWLSEQKIRQRRLIRAGSHEFSVSAREAASLQERSRGERKISLGVSIPGRRKLVTAERISPFNGTGRSSNASKSHPRVVYSNASTRQFRDFLLIAARTPLLSPAFHERKVSG